MARTRGYEWGRSPEEIREYVEIARTEWGKPGTMDLLAPSAAKDEEARRAFARFERQWASPGAYAALTTVREGNDVRHVLPAIRVPTLVIHRTECVFAPVDSGRYIAEHIPGARFVEV